MTFRQLALTLTAMAGTTVGVLSPAQALTFDFTTVSGDTLTADQANAFQTAANAWSASLSDNITVNVQIGFSSTLGANVLGATTPTMAYGSEAAIANLLSADAKDTTDYQAVASLGSDTQNSISVTSAEAKALGATLGPNFTTDGKIEFSSTFTFSTSRNADGTIASGTYDLIGIAEHEIGHLLGFVSSIDGGTSGVQTLLDQFRYSAPTARSVSAGTSAYFSVDSGFTNIAPFSTGIVNGQGDQASHWLQGVNGVMVPEASAGATQNITSIDLAALDAIGYDLVTAVPEPGTMAVLAIGLVGVAGTRRRFSRT